MVNNYKLDTEDESILKELDNMCGISHNKEILAEIIQYIKLKQNNQLDFGNYNIIVRNNSSYNFLNDLLKICAKIFKKYNIIENENICYLNQNMVSRKDASILNQISKIEDSIIVINDRKARIDYADDFDKLQKIIKNFPNKVFIFNDENYREGETDAELGELASFRMTINKVNSDDKIIYCQNRFNEHKLKYKKQDLKDFSDVSFWQLKNMVTQVIIDCKSKEIDFIDKQTLNKSKTYYSEVSNRRRRNKTTSNKKETEGKTELNKLIGLTEIKTQMNKILNYIKLNKERGQLPSLHMCFTGNPGTGKTSIARIIGKIFAEEKILSGNGEFVEIHGQDLVAKYVGWTAQKVHDTVEEAIGGVLFIDEAYSLVSDHKGSFADEAIATLIKEMEDHRHEICIILAGYTDEMKELIELNPGFESRIQFTINFPDYTENELLEIFNNLCKKEKYNLSKNCTGLLIDNFNQAKNSSNFGNGRYVRNLFEKVKFEQANRITQTNSKFINTITKADIEKVVETFVIPQEPVTRKIGFLAS